MKYLNKIPFAWLLLLAFSCENEGPAEFTSISGIWRCEEIDETAAVRIFNLDIDKVQSYDDTFLILNFHNAGESDYVRAYSTGDTLQIPLQGLKNFIVSGKGIIAPDFKLLTLDYVIYNNETTRHYSANCFR